MQSEILGEILRKSRLEEGDQALAARRVGVITEHDAADLLPHCEDGLAARSLFRQRRGLEVGVGKCVVVFGPEEQRQRVTLFGQLQARSPIRFLFLASGGLDDQQNIPRRDPLPLAGQYFLHHARDGSLKTDLHLHGFHQTERLPRLDAIAGLDVDRHHHGGSTRHHLSFGLPAIAVGVTIDLGAQTQIAAVIEHATDAIVDHQTRRVRALFAHRRGHDLRVEVNAVAPGTHGVHEQAVALALGRQVYLLTLSGRDTVDRDARRIGVEIHARGGALPLVGENGCGHQGVVRYFVVHRRSIGALFVPTIEPTRVDGALAVRVGVEDLQQIALVRRPPGNHELEVAQRTDEPRTRVFACGAGGDHLGDQGVEVRWHTRARHDARVDANTRPQRGIEERDISGRGQEARVGILGANPRLDRHTLLADLEPFQRLAASDPDLQLDEVDAGDLFRNSVLDLQTRIHFEEVVVLPRNQELHGADAHIANPLREPNGGALDLLAQRRGQTRRRSLFQHLLVSSLHGTVATPKGQDVAV